jgi:hypothetical protein
VSIYFDDRITHCRYNPDVHERMLHLMRRQRELGDGGEIVVGQLAADELHINVDYPSSPGYLDEVTQALGTDSRIDFGRFPGRDNDDTNAVTLTLPRPRWHHQGALPLTRRHQQPPRATTRKATRITGHHYSSHHS